MESDYVHMSGKNCKCMATYGMATDREEVGVGVRKCIVCARNFKLYSQYSKVNEAFNPKISYACSMAVAANRHRGPA